MLRRAVPEFETDIDTQNKILDTATKLFALKGFKAVTLKDIAKAVGIKVASIYYYYEDKDALIDGVLTRFDEVYSEYHDWLAAMNERARSLEEVIDNLFNQELLAKLSPVARLGMSMVLKEQHNHAFARQCVFKHIYEGAIQNVQTGFDRLVERKIIPPSDTKTLATLFMFCVVAGNEVLMYEYTDTRTPIDCAQVYDGLRKLMISELTRGTLTQDGLAQDGL